MLLLFAVLLVPASELMKAEIAHCKVMKTGLLKSGLLLKLFVSVGPVIKALGCQIMGSSY